jgi:hypothetical protein
MDCEIGAGFGRRFDNNLRFLRGWILISVFLLCWYEWVFSEEYFLWFLTNNTP